MRRIKGASGVLGVCAAVLLASSAAFAVDITINTTTTFQTIDGLGSFSRAPQLYVKAGDFYVERSKSWEIYRHVMDYGVGQPKEFITGAGWPIKAEGYKWGAFSGLFSDAREYKKYGADRYNISVLSPPGWMKQSGKEEGWGESASGGDNILLEANYDLMAQYIADFCKAFKDSVGVEPYAVSCQNEPCFTEPYQSCWYTGYQLQNLVDKTAARLKTLSLTTRIYGPEIMYSYGTGWGFDPFVTNANVYAFAAHGAQSAGHGGWADLKSKVPTKQLWMSEEPSQYNDLAAATELYNGTHGGNVSGWMYLDYSDQGTYTKSTGVTAGINIGWTPGGGYYGNKHFFRFIRPGAVRIGGDANNADILSVAFKNPDNTYAVVAINKGAAPATINLTGNSVASSWHLYQTTTTDKCKYMGTTTGANISIPASGIISLKSGDSIPPLKADTLPNTLPAPTPNNTVGFLSAFGDDILNVWVNGVKIDNMAIEGTGSNTIRRAVALNKGENVIAAYVRNSSWGGGLLASMMLPPKTVGGTPDTFRTDGTWKVTYKNPTANAAWTSLSYDDTKWAAAKDAGQANMWPGFSGWGMMAVNMFYQKARWILGGDKTYFRKNITPTAAFNAVYIRGNNFNYKLFINGAMVKSGSFYRPDSMSLGRAAETFPYTFTAGQTYNVAFEITDASSDGNGVLLKAGIQRSGAPMFLDTTWWCSDDTGATGWNKVATSTDTSNWSHPKNITAYDPLAGAGTFVYPADFYFRKKFTSTEATAILTSLQKTLRPQSLMQTKYFDLRGRVVNMTSRQAAMSKMVLIQRKVYRNGKAEDARIMRVK